MGELLIERPLFRADTDLAQLEAIFKVSYCGLHSNVCVYVCTRYSQDHDKKIIQLPHAAPLNHPPPLHTSKQIMGTPTEERWPGWSKLPNVGIMKFQKNPHNNLRAHLYQTYVPHACVCDSWMGMDGPRSCAC